MSGFGDDIKYPEVGRRYIPGLRKNMNKILGSEVNYQPFEMSKGFQGENLDVFWGLTGEGINFAFAGGNDADEEIVETFQKLYRKLAESPSKQDVQQFLAYSEKITDTQSNPDYAGVINVRDGLSAESLELQVYLDKSRESIDFATTSTGNQNEKVQEDNIARKAGKDDFEDFLDKLMYDVEKEISYWNHLDMSVDLEEYGFQNIGKGEVPESVNSHERYRDTEADVWQLPASKTDLESSSGFVKIWDLKQRDGMIAGSTSELEPLESYSEAVRILNKRG